MQTESLTTHSGGQRPGHAVVEDIECRTSVVLLGSLMETYVRRATHSQSTEPPALASTEPGNERPRVRAGQSDVRHADGRAVVATVRVDSERRIAWPSDLRLGHLAFVQVRCASGRVEIEFTDIPTGARLDGRNRLRLASGVVAVAGIIPGERVQVVATPDPSTFLLQAIARGAEENGR
jgi:hypothetical protein